MSTRAKMLNVRSQVVISLALIFGSSSYAQGMQAVNNNFTPTYKVEKCDCLGFSEDIPTFLSDLSDGHQDIYGEGKSLKEAQNSAQNMCVETYRNFASVSKTEDPNSVTRSGCHQLRSTPDGDWVAI